MHRRADIFPPRPLTVFPRSASYPSIAVRLLLGIALGTVGACGSVPDVEPVMNQSANADAKPQLAGSRGPLSVEQSKATLDKLRTQAPDSDVLQRHLAIEEAIAESPLETGNRTRILRDGTATFGAMFAAIRGARDHVNLEYYIVEEVESGGEHLGDLLLAKQAKGVQVNVIYDSYGSNATPAAFFARLKARGINVVDFNPVNPLDANSVSPDNRDHRKILVVDGETAIVGGVNLSADYEVRSLAKSGAIEGKPSRFVHDTDLQIDGPAVAQIQKLFLEHDRRGAPGPSGQAQTRGRKLAKARFPLSSVTKRSRAQNRNLTCYPSGWRAWPARRGTESKPSTSAGGWG